MGPFFKTSPNIAVILLAVSLCACGQVSTNVSEGLRLTTSEDENISLPPDSIYKPQSLLWEGQNPEALLWSAILYRSLGADEQNSLLQGTEDIEDFCPSFYSLSAFEKVNFWAIVISGISKYESGFDPLHRREVRPGIYKEGLLQISYDLHGQLRRCRFDEANDNRMNPMDPRRSIVDPKNQMACAVDVLTHQIETQKRLAHNGSYWRVLRLNTKFSAIEEIKTFTRQLTFCSPSAH